MANAHKNIHISVDLITVAMFVFAVLKLAHVIEVSWWIILFPVVFWVSVILVIFVGGLSLLGIEGTFATYRRYKQKKASEKHRNKYI